MPPVLSSRRPTSTFSSPGTRIRLNTISSAGKRLGGVEPHLGADAVARRRIELRALAFGNDDQVAVGLEAGRHRPFDLGRIVDVDVLVDDDDVLDVVMTGEGAHHDVLGLALLALVDLHIEVIAARPRPGRGARRARSGTMRCRCASKRRFARDRAEQQMLQAAADDGVEDRVLAMRDRIDLHHVPLGALAVILRKLAERPFGLAHARQETALDHDLRVGRHPQFAGQAFDHGQRPPVQRAGDLQLVDIDRQRSPARPAM